MKLKAGTVILAFIWCIFMGITVGSIGIGAIFPAANLISKPFVCPRGDMQLETQDYHPSPVETVTTLTWYCADTQTGAKTEISLFSMALPAGTIYGLLLFALVYLGMTILAYRTARNPQEAASTGGGIDMDRINADVERSEQLRQQAEQFRQRAEGLRSSAGGSSQTDFAQLTGKSRSSGDALSRMKELKELRQANLISEVEYEQKRAEILKEL